MVTVTFRYIFGVSLLLASWTGIFGIQIEGEQSLRKGLHLKPDKLRICKKYDSMCAHLTPENLSNGTENTSRSRRDVSECEAFKGPDGNPYYNIRNALMGYDIINGDPFHDGGDPGFRNEIFQATVRTEGGTYQLANISVSNVLQCKLSMTTQTHTNYNSYNEAKVSSLTESKGFQIGLEATVRAKVSVATVAIGVKLFYGSALSNSADSRKMKQYFSSGENMVMVSEATCMDHQVTINKIVPPPFKETFVEHLRRLESAHDKVEEVQEKMYVSFIQSYGTHYQTTSRFGAKIVVESLFSKSDFNTEQLEEESKCRSERFGIDLLIINIATSSNKCTQNVQGSSRSGSERQQKTEVRTIGSRPILKLEEWANQKFTQPAVVRMELDPIPNLLAPDKLQSYGINSSRILSWLLPMFYNHCNISNKYLPPERQIPCSPPQGCGYSDNCTVEEVCRNGSDGSPECASEFGNLLAIGNHEAPRGSVELISFTNSKTSLSKYPGHLAVGTYIDNNVIACGGHSSVSNYHTNLCHEYNPISNKWTQSSFSMKTVRIYSASVQLSPTEWWVTGGLEGNGQVAITTEVYNVANRGFSFYVDLPEARYGHNIVQIDGDQYVLLGGGTATRSAWMFNKKMRLWSPLPNLLESRTQTHAGFVRYPDGRRFVVVAGGVGSKTSEALDLVEMTWSYLTSLPVTESLYLGASVQYGKTFLVVGGQSGGYAERSIFKYDVEEEKWIILPAKLTEGRREFSAFLVPTDFVPPI